jgi:hypothetical protein
MVLVLALGFLSLPKTTKLPTYHGAIQVYRTGVWESDSSHTWRGIFKGFSKDAELTPGPGNFFAITDGQVVLFKGKQRLMAVEKSRVIGWCGQDLLVRKKGHNYLVSASGKRRLSKLLEDFKRIEGWDLRHLFGIREGSPLRDLSREHEDCWFDGTKLIATQAFPPLDSFIATKKGLFGGPSDEDPAESERLCLIPWFSDERQFLPTQRADFWLVRRPDKAGRILATADIYARASQKFFDHGIVYLLQQGRPARRLTYRPGEFTAYAFDTSGQWILGQDLQGFEMGAYDLVGFNLKTKKTVQLEHGVEEYQPLD